MTIGFEDYLACIQSLKSDYQHFIQVLEALKPALQSWFQAISHDPIPFMIPNTSFLKVYDKGFPAAKTGDFPDQIVRSTGFLSSPGDASWLYLAPHVQSGTIHRHGAST
jgi:hypothetical protein